MVRDENKIFFIFFGKNNTNSPYKAVRSDAGRKYLTVSKYEM
jgi:ABC-type Zn uptake system ZnuABC Zn-binding protein ZnuA